MVNIMQKKSKNKQGKIRNATENIYNGIKFRSKLETYTYKKLKSANINVEYENKRYTLLPAFRFDDVLVRAITYLPDFVGNKFIIECKGYPNDAWPLREKLMKYYLATNEPDIKYYIVHTQKEVDKLIELLK